MEKVTVSICGRNYTFTTDEPAETLRSVANRVEQQIYDLGNMIKKSEVDVLTIVAFDIAHEADKINKDKDMIINELRVQVTELAKTKEDVLRESMASAAAEFEHISDTEQEKEDEIRRHYQEYEQNLAAELDKKEREIDELRKSYESAKTEMYHMSDEESIEENDMRETLVNYEKNFDMYTKTKEDEIQTLQKELNKSKSENDELKQRLAALGDDNQLTL